MWANSKTNDSVLKFFAMTLAKLDLVNKVEYNEEHLGKHNELKNLHKTNGFN